MGVVDVKHTAEHELTLEWDASASNDMIADSTVALIISIDRSPASAKCELFSIILNASPRTISRFTGTNPFPRRYSDFNYSQMSSSTRNPEDRRS